MATTGVAFWSQTAATNATADSSIGWAEGQAPSTVNDSARAMMASTAKWRDDLAGTLTTGGTSTAYTLTTNQVFPSLTTMSGQALRVKFDKTNGTSATLNVDGLNAKAIVTVTGTAVPSGFIKANNVYDLVYANGSSEWILTHGSAIAGQFAAGTAIVFFQAAAPSGWTKSSANNDKALRVVSGTGGGTGGSTAFTTVFGSRTIATANLPNNTLSHTLATQNTAGTFNVGNNQGNNAASGSGLNVPFNATTLTISNTLTGSISLGGSGTAMDFAVQYLDCIVCTKD